MTTEPLVDLQPTIVYLRESLGLSRKELAEALGVSEAEVARDEQCGFRRMPLERARRLLQLLAGLEKQATSVARQRRVSDRQTPREAADVPRRSAPPRKRS